MSHRARGGGTGGWIKQRRGDKPVGAIPAKQQIPRKRTKKKGR